MELTSMITPRSIEIIEYLTSFEIEELLILEIMRRLYGRNGLRDIPYLNIFQSMLFLFYENF